MKNDICVQPLNPKSAKLSADFGYIKCSIIDLKHLEEISLGTKSQEDLENGYQPLDVENLQQYQPIYSLFFDMTNNNYNSIQFNYRYQMGNMNSVIDSQTKKITQKPEHFEWFFQNNFFFLLHSNYLTSHIHLQYLNNDIKKHTFL